MEKELILRAIRASDAEEIHQAFKEQNWDKPISQYLKYLEYQESGERDVIIAEFNNLFAGYLTISWKSNYSPFQKENIPEIVDLNVLKKYQKKGIATGLLNEAEKRIKKVSIFAGIGFGVYEDYGAAQILYIKRGYIPDGRGLIKNFVTIKYGEKIEVNDEIAMYLKKKL